MNEFKTIIRTPSDLNLLKEKLTSLDVDIEELEKNRDDMLSFPLYIWFDEDDADLFVSQISFAKSGEGRLISLLKILALTKKELQFGNKAKQVPKSSLPWSEDPTNPINCHALIRELQEKNPTLWLTGDYALKLNNFKSPRIIKEVEFVYNGSHEIWLPNSVAVFSNTIEKMGYKYYKYKGLSFYIIKTSKPITHGDLVVTHFNRIELNALSVDKIIEDRKEWLKGEDLDETKTIEYQQSIIQHYEANERPKLLNAFKCGWDVVDNYPAEYKNVGGAFDKYFPELIETKPAED